MRIGPNRGWALLGRRPDLGMEASLSVRAVRGRNLFGSRALFRHYGICVKELGCVKIR